MSYEEWIEKVKAILKQYDEGAVLANEVFNAVIAKAVEVEQVVAQEEP